MVVDGIWRMDNVKPGGGRVKRVDQREEEAVWRARELASLEATTPTHISIATKHTTTSTLNEGQYKTQGYHLQWNFDPLGQLIRDTNN
jgi:hypothetical protein